MSNRSVMQMIHLHVKSLWCALQFICFILQLSQHRLEAQSFFFIIIYFYCSLRVASLYLLAFQGSGVVNPGKMLQYHNTRVVTPSTLTLRLKATYFPCQSLILPLHFPDVLRKMVCDFFFFFLFHVLLFHVYVT